MVLTDAEIRALQRRHSSPSTLLHLASGQFNLDAATVGLGKTTLARGIVEHPLVNFHYGLVLFMAGQRGVLEEMPMAHRQQEGVRLLGPRDASHCGRARHGQWNDLASRGCSTLARMQVCATCSNLGTCRWYEQFKDLEDCTHIFGTQAYLNLVPDLFAMLVRARKTLIILDEAFVLTQRYKVRVSGRQLQMHLAALDSVKKRSRVLENHRHATRILLDPRQDVCSFSRVSPLSSGVAAAVQAEGLNLFGNDYQYMGWDIARGSIHRRYRNADGELVYIRRPWFWGATVLSLAADLHPQLCMHRLGLDDVNVLYKPTPLQHCGSQIYNLSSKQLSTRWFETHAPSLIFMYAQLILREHEDGRQTLLVTKKRYKELCRGELQRALAELGAPRLGGALQMIHYGVQGINTYKNVDTVICLNAYNAHPQVFSDFLNDVHLPEERVQVEISPGDRRGRAIGDVARDQGFSSLAELYRQEVETSVAVQAAGRVRFATRPRKVFFAQASPPPYQLAGNFRSVDAFRKHFGLRTRTQLQAVQRRKSIARARARGMTQRQTAGAQGCSLSTVKRYWNR